MIQLGVGILLAFATSWVWVAVLRRHWGLLLGFCAVLVGNFWVLLGVLVVVAAARLDLVSAVVIVWLAAGVVGLLLWLRERRNGGDRLPTGATLTWLPSALGGFLWLAVLIISQFVPGATRLSWAMTGDSANNILFARDIIMQPGVALGTGENPVPLSSAIAATSMAFGRDGVPPAELLRHDVTAFATVWALLLAVSCIMAGLVASVIARSCDARPLVIRVSGALASLLMLSWMLSGYPIQLGFFNVHVALPIVFAALLVYFGSDARPGVALAVLTFASTLLLASWSPLVLIPGALGFVIVVRQWRGLWATRRAAAWLLLVGFAQMLAFGIFVVVPQLLFLGADVAGAGGTAPFARWMIPAVCVFTVLAAVLATGRLTSLAFLGVVAVSVSAGIGVAIFLASTRREDGEWGYYSMKLAWLMTIILVVVCVGLVPAVIARVIHHRAVVTTVFGLAFAGATVLAIVTPFTHLHPIAVRILGGFGIGHGDVAAERIFELADPQQPRILWESNIPEESTVNFWLWQMTSESLDDGFALRAAAYNSAAFTEVSQLCSVLHLTGPNSEVLTESTRLAADLVETCPDEKAVVTLLR